MTRPTLQYKGPSDIYGASAFDIQLTSITSIAFPTLSVSNSGSLIGSTPKSPADISSLQALGLFTRTNDSSDAELDYAVDDDTPDLVRTTSGSSLHSGNSRGSSLFGFSSSPVASLDPPPLKKATSVEEIPSSVQVTECSPFTLNRALLPGSSPLLALTLEPVPLSPHSTQPSPPPRPPTPPTCPVEAFLFNMELRQYIHLFNQCGIRSTEDLDEICNHEGRWPEFKEKLKSGGMSTVDWVTVKEGMISRTSKGSSMLKRKRKPSTALHRL
ncbi:hypothetical protein K474DRAFT_771331 [Panus rudis PR-1116 ss-1]|nr:hypothetical protein K474DRAFT_771331 [Panus rudis PR-1116 ss-1]